jgi:hypothetical protein
MTFGILSNFFQKLLRPANPQQANLPWGLTSDGVEQLNILLSTPAWANYSALLEAVAERQGRELLRGLDRDRYLFTCGAIYALQQAYRLPHDLTAKQKEQHTRDDARQRIDADESGRADHIFFNTPWYDDYIRDAINRGGTQPVESGT